MRMIIEFDPATERATPTLDQPGAGVGLAPSAGASARASDAGTFAGVPGEAAIPPASTETESVAAATDAGAAPAPARADELSGVTRTNGAAARTEA